MSPRKVWKSTIFTLFAKKMLPRGEMRALAPRRSGVTHDFASNTNDTTGERRLCTRVSTGSAHACAPTGYATRVRKHMSTLDAAIEAERPEGPPGDWYTDADD
jgi:hypothetical protein